MCLKHGKKSIFQGRDRSSPNALMVLHWWTCSQLSIWRICLFFLSIYQNHKLYPRLTQQNIYDFSTPPHCERPDGKHEPASKKNHLQSFRQDTEPGQQWLQIWFSTRGKGAVPDRELLTSRSTRKVSCPASLFPVFQEVLSFHSGAKSGMFTQALPENIPKEMELNNATALNLQHPVGTSLAAAGEPRAKYRTGGKRHHNVKNFLFPRVRVVAEVSSCLF